MKNKPKKSTKLWSSLNYEKKGEMAKFLWSTTMNKFRGHTA